MPEQKKPKFVAERSTKVESMKGLMRAPERSRSSLHRLTSSFLAKMPLSRLIGLNHPYKAQQRKARRLRVYTGETTETMIEDVVSMLKVLGVTQLEAVDLLLDVWDRVEVPEDQ